MSDISRRSILGGVAMMAIPSAIISVSAPVPATTAKERAEHHFAELQKALEEINGPHKANLDWELGVAMLIATGDPKTYKQRGTAS